MNWFIRILRDRRGTSTAEAAVVLPVMAICWAGLFLRFQGIELALDAAMEARRDAWTFSGQGCEVESGRMPPGIGRDCAKGDHANWMSKLESVPVLGPLVQTILGFEIHKTAHREHDAPPLFGGGKRGIGYTYYLMCNEKPREGLYVLALVICSQFQAIHLPVDIIIDCPQPPPKGDCS
jgi:hypothetical protein